MQVKCINNSEGDFWSLTIGKPYKVEEVDKDYLMYIDKGKRITEERYLITDDTGTQYKYPIYCFEKVGE